MDQPRWERLGALFLDALDRAPPGRRAFVERACAGDTALRDELLAMLAAHDDEHGLALEQHLVEDGRRGADAVMAVGTRIGPYRVEAVVGEGGMGTVYRASRDDAQFRRRVAIKLVKRGMDTDEIVRRFRHERQILASLEHPHIARLYDGGVTDDGRPYLVMELVEGQRITTYCDERRLGLDERLALVETVCAAVQHAHQNLVVHRDLKPANILVTAQGAVKLLDFGIAKLLGDDDLLRTAPHTRTGLRLLTLEYASPEQLRGQPITTASDVYALGVVLYELLCGRRPHALAGRAPGERERVLLDDAVERPSVVVARDDDAATRVAMASARATTPDRLRRRLRGDLDTITLRALAKSADRRYQSAEQLAAELRRHRLGLPVAARPDGTLYRAGRFARRHRMAVASAVLVLLSLVGGLGAALWQSDRAARQRDAARELSAFLETLFQSADPFAPTAPRGDSLRVRDFLANGTATVQRELGDQPAVQARLLTVLGRVYQRLGSYEQAQALLEQALQLRVALAGIPALEVAESRQLLATVLRDRGRLDDAEPLLRTALAERTRLQGPRHPEVAASRNDLGILLRLRGRYDEAEREHLAALAILRAADRGREREIGVLGDLVATLDEKGDLAGSTRHARAALALSRATYGSGHPRVAIAMQGLALARQREGHYAEAETLIVEALTTGERALGPEHPRVADILGRLASIEFWQGDFAAAAAAHRRALAIKRRVYGDAHLVTTDAMYDLAQALRGKGDLAEAEALNRESLALVRRALGDDHPVVASYLSNLGATLEERGDCRGAEPIFRESMERLQATVQPHSYRILLAQQRLGGCVAALGRYAEAESLLVGSHERLRASFGAADSRVRTAAGRLATLYGAWGRPAEAALYGRLAGAPAGR